MDVRRGSTTWEKYRPVAALLLAVLLAAWWAASAGEARGAGDAARTAAPWQVTLGLSAVKVAAGASVTYSGTVRTADGQPGAGTVTVQKRRASGGDWIQWRTAELDADGAYTVTVDMVNRQTWEFRARMPGDGGQNETGYSAIVGLTVGPAAVAYGPGEYAFTISGRGWGHGIGMSQWGAYGLAKHGRGYRAILRHYYTGIGFAKVKNRTVRVLLRRGVGTVKLTCADRYTVSGGAGTFSIPGGTTATVTRSGAGCRVVAGKLSKVLGATVTFSPTRARLDVRTASDLGQTGKHRGRVRVAAYGSSSLIMVNLVALESYLRGVVPHEVPSSWPAAALRAQACAARAYAESARRSSGSRQWDLYCDVRSQAYGGVAWEQSRTDVAIRGTAGVVPVYGGRPIQAFYFSCSGGHTENIEDAWQTSAVPYLKGVVDPYDGAAPLHTWGPLRRTPAQLAKALSGSVKGSLRAIYRVKAGASPRIVKAAVIGSGGTTYLHGSTLRSKLGLNSTWATFWSMSVRPAASDRVVVSAGEKVTLSGCVYPALASGATVTLRYGEAGAWHSRRVSTVRHVRKLDGGAVARYSTYKVVVAPTTTARYFFERGVARSPQTTIAVE
jgi:stage II sporulation protein D